MLIKKVELNNIRSYVQDVVVFSEGTTLLNGDIGGGKSTILLAIAFALFGADTDALSGDALLRKGASEGHVGLSFDVQGVDVFIHRGLKRSKKTVAQTEGYMLVNGVRKDAMPIELKAEIINLLGYPDELVTKKKNLIFTYTVYCPQEEMKVILSENKDDRLDTLRKIFGIDKYKRVADNCAILLREFRVRMREIEAQTADLPALVKQCDDLKIADAAVDARMRQTAPRFAALKNDLDKSKENHDIIEKQLAQLRDKKRALDFAHEQLRLKKEIIVRNEVKIQQLAKIIQSGDVTGVVDVAQLQIDVDRKEKLVVDSILHQQSVKQKIMFAVQKIKDLERDVSMVPSSFEKQALHDQFARQLLEKFGVEQKLNEEEKAVERLKSVRREYELRQAQADDVIAKLTALSTCPLCLQHVSDIHKVEVKRKQSEEASFYTLKINDVQLTIRDAAIRVEQLQKQLRVLETVDRQRATIAGELKFIEQQSRVVEMKQVTLVELRKALEQFETDQKNFKDLSVEKQDLAVLKKKVELLKESMHAEKECAELKTVTAALEKDCVLLTQQVELLTADTAQFDAVERERQTLLKTIDTLRVAEKNLAIQLAQLETERKNIAQRVTQLVLDIERKEEARKKSQMIVRMVNWLDQYFVPLMSIIEKHVLARIYTEFNDYFKQWFSVLVADDGFTARLDDSFAPILEQNGYEIDVAYLSGGERTSAALAYRL